MSQEQRPPDPPQAPEIDRRFRLYPYQWIGLPLMMLVPVLALFGVFGQSWDTARGATAALELELRYPSRFRYKQLNGMDVYVTNSSGRQLDTVTVSFDTAYINRFSTVTFVPSATGAYEVELTKVEPDERRLIRVELQGEKYWLHRGLIQAWAAGSDTLRVPVSTVVFP